MKVGKTLALFSLAFSGVLASPALASSYDAAFVHAVDPGVGRTLAGDVESRLFAALDGPTAPRLMPVEQVTRSLLADGNGASISSQADADIEAARTRLSEGNVSRELIDELDRAREALLSSMTTRPKMEAIRDAWALRGLAVHMLGEPEAARRDFARVIESDPSYRPDPRLFPPGAREQMGRALMARTDSHWRVLCSADVSALGRRLGVDYVIVAHLQDTGLVELTWRVDVFDVVAGRFIGEAEVHFPDVAAERARAAAEVAGLIGEVVPRLASTPRHVQVTETRGTGQTTRPPADDPPPDPRIQDTGRRVATSVTQDGQTTSPAFDLRDPGPGEPKARSKTGWIVATAILVIAAGGTAAYVGLTADPGTADLQVNLHR